MSSIADLYQNLFGKNHITDGSVIDMAEHQRVGDVSTGQGYKAVGILNAAGSLVSDFGGTSSAFATVTAVQGSPGTVPWLFTLATLSVVTQPGAGALATVTAHQGLSGATPWLITMATMPVVGSFSISDVPVAGGSLSAYQAGAWSVLASIPVPTSVLNAGGSLTAYQGGAWNVLASLSGSPSILVAGGSLSAAQLGTWTVAANAGTNLNTSALALEAGNLASVKTNTDNLNVTLGSRLASGATLPVTGNIGQLGTWTVQPGNTPNTTAWLVTMGTIPVAAAFSGSVPVAGGSLSSYVAGGSLTAYQGSAPWSMANAGGSLTVYPGNVPNTIAWLITMATQPVFASQAGTWSVTANAGTNLNTSNLDVTLGSRLASGATLPVVGNLGNAGGSLSAYQGGLWNVLASISGVPTVLASLPSASSFLAAGGSLTAFKNNASNAMTTMVSASATAVTLLAANSARKGASFYNNSTAILYLRNGAGASTSAFKIAMAASSYFEEPADYSGVVSGTWASAAGSVAVTEEY